MTKNSFFQIIKKLDLLLKSKQTKENELQFLQEDLELTDVKIASIKS